MPVVVLLAGGAALGLTVLAGIRLPDPAFVTVRHESV
jgi:hypothetical protein